MKTALFDSKYARLVGFYKAGAHLRVQLRSWPEWPGAETHSIDP